MSSKTKVIGLLSSWEYHKAKHVLQELSSDLPDHILPPHCEPLMEFQWLEYIQDLKKEHGGDVWGFTGSVAVFVNQQLLGGLQSLLYWVEHNFGQVDFESEFDYEKQARSAYNSHITNPKRDYVFMDVFVDGDLAGRMVFELFKDLCPKTCANFVALCTGEKGKSSSGTLLSYVNSIIHRVVQNGWIQGGDICGGSGSKGESIYGDTFEDESFAVSHNSPGILGMCNHGRNTNNSQFYVILKPSPWMDRQYVAFGRIVEGRKVLKKIGEMETYNNRPNQLCQISNTGVLAPKTDLSYN